MEEVLHGYGDLYYNILITVSKSHAFSYKNENVRLFGASIII